MHNYFNFENKLKFFNYISNRSYWYATCYVKRWKKADPSLLVLFPVPVMSYSPRPVGNLAWGLGTV